jgi:C-terminal processing protease CtpA/Prc
LLPVAEVTNSALAMTKETGKSKTISRIILAIEKRDAVKPYKFVVGNCAIYKTAFGKEQAKGAFFYDFTKDKRYEAPHYMFKNFGNSVPIKQYTSFTNFSIPEYHFESDSMVHANGMEDAATINLFRYFIERYPYYKERDLNKEKIISAMDTISQLKCPLKLKLEKVDSLINRFNDGHFYIMSKGSSKLVNGPVLAKEIKGRIYVVGVFDSVIRKKIQPGMEILEIDHSPVNRYIDSTALKYHGGRATTRQMAVARMFYRTYQDSMQVIFKNESGLRQEILIHFKKQHIVPDNFRSEHMFFNYYPNNWGYLKLNRWQTTDWIPFYNLADTLTKLNGLIFDLRGNGGGAQLQAIRILTCFLKKPAVYSYNTYQPSGIKNKVYLGSHIVIPNQYLNLSRLKVIILVDGMTACASEVFINGMKKYCSAIVVGSENTNGAYADAAYFYLPQDIVVKANLLDKLYLSRDLKSIEGIGIRPDIIVEITKYEDLYPYQDKILKEAIAITNRLNSDHEFKVAHDD